MIPLSCNEQVGKDAQRASKSAQQTVRRVSINCQRGLLDHVTVA